MIPRETGYANIPGPSGKVRQKARGTRLQPPKTYGQRTAPPISFSSTPLRTPEPQALAQEMPYMFDPTTTSTPMSRRPAAPRSALQQELDQFDPFTPIKTTPPQYTSLYTTPKTSLKYTISNTPSLVTPSFERSAEVVPDMIGLDEAAPPCPSYECAPEEEQVAKTPRARASVKMTVPTDDQRTPKVIPSYERTPEEMLPPVESDRPPRKRHTTAADPRYSLGGMSYIYRFLPQNRKGRGVRHSFETDEEPEPPPFPPPPHLAPVPRSPCAQPQPTPRAKPQRPTATQKSRVGVPKRATVAVPSRPKKQPPRVEVTPEEKTENWNPLQKHVPCLQIGSSLVGVKPPVACARSLESSYVSHPQQKGGSFAKVHEEIMEVHGDPAKILNLKPLLKPKPQPGMLAKTPKRPIGGLAPPPAIDYSARKQLPGIKPKVFKAPKKEELDMMALARQRYKEAAAQRGVPSTPGTPCARIQELPESTRPATGRRPPGSTAPSVRQPKTYRRF